MSNITTFLTYADRAEEAVKLYVSIFKRSRILHTTHYPDVPVAPTPGGVMTIEFGGVSAANICGRRRHPTPCRASLAWA